MSPEGHRCAGGVVWESRLERSPRPCLLTRKNIPIALLIDPSHVYVYSLWRGLNYSGMLGAAICKPLLYECYRAHSDSVGDCVDAWPKNRDCQ